MYTHIYLGSYQFADGGSWTPIPERLFVDAVQVAPVPRVGRGYFSRACSSEGCFSEAAASASSFLSSFSGTPPPWKRHWTCMRDSRPHLRGRDRGTWGLRPKQAPNRVRSSELKRRVIKLGVDKVTPGRGCPRGAAATSDPAHRCMFDYINADSNNNTSNSYYYYYYHYD